MIAIKTENIGKKFLITAHQKQRDTLAETLMQGASIGLSKLKASLRKTGSKRMNTTGNTEFWALRDISFDLNKGDILGVIGHNGSGKSTLLKILSRITPPTEGSARIYGRVGSLLEIGTGFHGELTGRENTYLSGTILGMKHREIDDHFDRIVEFSGVEKFIDTPVKKYSSGMYLRLAFAVAAHLRTEILLIDEVLSVGDASFRKKCIDKMSEVAREGRTVIFVSHNLGAVSRLCGSGMLLNEGKMVFSGSIDETIGYYGRIIAQKEEAGLGEQKEDVFIKRLLFSSEEGDVLQPSSTITAEFQLSISSVFWKFFIQLGVSTPDGLNILLDVKDSNEVKQFLEPGNYKVKIKLPPLWLRPGVYSSRIKVIAHPESGETKRFYSSWVDLHIEAGTDFDSISHRVLAPQTDWSVEVLGQLETGEVLE